MRTSALALVLLACGGAPAKPTPDACKSYRVSIAPAIQRLSRAADAFSAEVGEGPAAAVSASLELAGRLDAERAPLADVRPEREDIGRAHAHLRGALGGLSDALRFLADVVSRRDETQRDTARSRFHDAQSAWQGALTELKTVCP